MSLIDFHRFLILAAIAFCLGFAGWELRSYLQLDGGTPALLLALLFVVLAIGLTVYLARLRSFLRLDDRR